MAEFALTGYGFENDGRTWQEPYIGGTNDRRLFPQFTFQASVGADTYAWFVFRCITAPSDTLKALLTYITDGTGNAQINIHWAAVSTGASFDTTSLTAEGTTQIAVAAGDVGDIQEEKIDLDATTDPTAGQYIIIQVEAETTSWTLNGKSFWWLTLLDEV